MELPETLHSQEVLDTHGIPVVQNLPGIGRNHQDHLAFGCTWAYQKPEAIGGSGCEAKLYWKSDSRLAQPAILQCQLEFPVPSPIETGLETPENGWTMFNGLAQPKSRGRLRLSGPDTSDPMLIEPNSLSEPEDMTAALAAVELCRELGSSETFTPLLSGETAPGPRDRSGMVEVADLSFPSGHAMLSAVTHLTLGALLSQAGAAMSGSISWEVQSCSPHWLAQAVCSWGSLSQ